MSDMDWAKLLLGGGKAAPEGITGTRQLATSTRRGTVVAVNGDGTVDVVLDGGDAQVRASAQGATFEVGDRVTVVWQNGAWIVYGLASTVAAISRTHQQLADRIREEGERIEASAAADLKEVSDSLDAFRASHQLTDADIEKRVADSASEVSVELSAAIDERVGGLGETYALKSEVSQQVGELRSEVSETYAKATDVGEMSASLQSQVTQNSEQIAAEVAAREEAVSGALSDARSYVDQQADSITSTVTREVTDSMGKTYATKSEVEHTAEGIRTTVSGQISTAKQEVKDDLSGDISAAQSAASAAQSSASTALSKANESATFIETHFEQTTNGLTVSSSASSYSARVAPGAFEILDTSDAMLLRIYASSSIATIQPRTSYGLGLQSAGGECRLNIDKSDMKFSAAAGLAFSRTGQNLGTGYYYAWHQLYANSSGTSGTVTLSYSADKFVLVAIVYKEANDNQHSCIVRKGGTAGSSSTTATYANLSASYMIPGNGAYTSSKIVTVQGTSISTYNSGGYYAGHTYAGIGSNVSVGTALSTSDIKIVAVYGLQY